MDYAKESLKRHEQWKGKIEVVCTVPLESKEDLSLAYTPCVTRPFPTNKLDGLYICRKCIRVTKVQTARQIGI